jgi:outer membrane immunogenic protein
MSTPSVVVIPQQISNFFPPKSILSFLMLTESKGTRTDLMQIWGQFMRKLFHTVAALSALVATSMTANAADVTARPYSPPPYVPPAYVAPVFTWTGFYLGGNIGGAWRNDNLSDTLSGLNFSNGNNNGVFIGGGQLGFNWQVSNFVLGFEWDIDGAANNNNTGTVFVPALGTIQVTSNNRWITTLAARFGVTNGYWLFYGKAGGGWVGNDDFTINNLTTGTSITASNNNTNSGWLLGAGIEWAFAPNWSAKVEYNYLGLDDRTFIVPAGVPGFLPGDTFTQSNRNIQMVKVGINYLFNWSGYRY